MSANPALGRSPEGRRCHGEAARTSFQPVPIRALRPPPI